MGPRSVKSPETSPARGTATPGENRSGLFPLPFSPFERYYWSDDSVNYPTTYPVELKFSGRFDRAAFQRALADALARHPLVGARVADDGRTPPQWIAGPAEPPVIEWADAQQGVGGRAVGYIDLRRESGLRVWVRESVDASRVVLQFHHACCDGIGMFQFLEDWLACYAAAAGGDGPPRLGELDVERIRHRDRVMPDDAPPGSLASALRDLLVLTGVWGDVLLSRPARLVAPATTAATASSAPDTSFVDFQNHAFTAAETSALRDAARASGVTTNELLAHDLLLVLRDWNRREGDTGGGRLRLNVPVNVREPSDATMPAANRIGFAFVAPAKRDYRDPRRLLEAIRKQMQRAKDWKLGLYFLGGLAFAANHPRIARWVLRRKGGFATVVFSNLGRVYARSRLARADGHLACGNVVLEGIAAVPPIRPQTRAALVAMEYAGQLSLSLRCDPHLFTPADSQALLDQYVERLRKTAGEIA